MYGVCEEKQRRMHSSEVNRESARCLNGHECVRVCVLVCLFSSVEVKVLRSTPQSFRRALTSQSLLGRTESGTTTLTSYTRDLDMFSLGSMATRPDVNESASLHSF